MLLLELLLTFAKGILIGLLVSAPMGPTGLLCMRETTRGRRRDGMLVGLGATLSDLVYGLIAYWGVGIVLNLLDQYSSSLRLGGSIFILGFCIILLTRHVSTSEDYARLEFVRAVKLQFVELFVAMAGIGIGCLLWWVILTYIVKKLSVRFGMKSLEWINRIVALVLIILALVGIYTSLFE